MAAFLRANSETHIPYESRVTRSATARPADLRRATAPPRERPKVSQSASSLVVTCSCTEDTARRAANTNQSRVESTCRPCLCACCISR